MSTNPIYIANKFIENVDTSQVNHERLIVLIERDHNRISFENMLVEQFILSIAVKWEAFVNDIIISYVMIDPKPYLDKLKDRVNQSNLAKFGKIISKNIKYVPPKNLSFENVQLILNPEGMNITSSSNEILRKKATDYLSGKYAKRFSLNIVDAIFLDFFIASRNYLSHKSSKSKYNLKKTHDKLCKRDKSTPLAGKLNPIGKFLRYKSIDKKSRAIHMAKSIIAIARKLV